MITVTQRGFKKIDGYFEKLLEKVNLGNLDEYGIRGVQALMASTPRDTGLAAHSWYYSIDRSEEGLTKLVWSNSDIEGGCNVAVLLQYGHGTKSGSWVEGIDYINPALRPIFEEIAEKAWRDIVR